MPRSIPISWYQGWKLYRSVGNRVQPYTAKVVIQGKLQALHANDIDELKRKIHKANAVQETREILRRII